jgi:hypothetical protein
MSTETSELNQPNDGSDSDEPRRRFGFRHADTGVDEDGVDRDVVTTGVDDEDDTGLTDVTGGSAVYDSADDPDVVDEDVVEPTPTFTPSDSGPTAILPDPREPVDGSVVQGEVVPDDATDVDGRLEPTTLDDATLDDSTVDDTTVPASVPVTETVPASEAPLAPATDFDPNAPLLGDSVSLRASWQQAAAEFVDDPRAAVADAAELVEHTAQTLIGALQQRQRQLRGRWENGTAAGVNGSDATVDGTNGTVDTEELRHLMQSYRALFNQLTNS